MLKVLFAVAEAVPFVKTGGLADVAGSLPKELNKQGIATRVMMPKYQDIRQNFTKKMTLTAQCTVNVGWRKQYCGIQELEHDGVIFYFIDNEYYFKRPGFYGYYDDAERYAFFCRAVLEALQCIDFVPDVIHCHDWHTGMVSVFLRSDYCSRPPYQHISTLFTVHNLKYQGVFPKEILEDLLGLDWSYFTVDGIEFYDQVNFMKGGLNYSDLISTVSKTYAGEIQYPFFGEKLDGLLRRKSADLHGIINGIDYQSYNPATDQALFANFDRHKPERKQENKIKLQEMLGLPTKADTPLLAIVSRLVSDKGIDLIACLWEELLELDVQLAVLGTGEYRYEELFKYAAGRFPGKVAARILFDDGLARKIYAGADILLMPSLFEPCGIAQMIAMRYGCLPLVRETGGLKDTVQSFNERTGQGNGFSFANYNAHDMLFTIKRAISLYKKPAIWQKIMANAMKADYSWSASAAQYHDLYRQLTSRLAQQKPDPETSAGDSARRSNPCDSRL